jgi:hypothetical protein
MFNDKVTTSPDFYLSVMNSIFERKFVKKQRSRKFEGSIKAKKGINFFEGYSMESLKGKTLLIDKATADKMLKSFNDEPALKSIISKITEISKDNIFILSMDEICKSFLSENKDILYMYTHYNYIEMIAIGHFWMPPNIFDYKGRFVASLDKYKKLKKMGK